MYKKVVLTFVFLNIGVAFLVYHISNYNFFAPIPNLFISGYMLFEYRKVPK